MVNAGTYRVQVHDSKTLGIMISPGKHGRLIREKYWAKGEACPVAVSFGQDPLLLLLGGLEVDYGEDEFAMAGGIRNEPLDVVAAPLTGLPVPATSEIVIEGEIPPDQFHQEGPFGEWTGYYASGERDMPIINVKSINWRNGPHRDGLPAGQAAERQHVLPQPPARGDALERAGARGRAGRRWRVVARGRWRALPERHLHQADVPRPREAGGATRRPPCTRARTPTASSSWSTTTSTPPTRTRCCGRSARAPR